MIFDFLKKKKIHYFIILLFYFLFFFLLFLFFSFQTKVLCGVPGTGKTAVVLDIVRHLRQDKVKFFFSKTKKQTNKKPNKTNKTKQNKTNPIENEK